MLHPDRDIAYFANLDARLVEVARPIKVLSSLGWSQTVAQTFLAGWAAGHPKLPDVSYAKLDYRDRREALLKIIGESDLSHPLGRYVIETARSYVSAATMLEHTGNPTFTQLSQEIYGAPKDHIGRLSNLTLADDFIKLTDDMGAAATAPSHEKDLLSPEEAASILFRRASGFFNNRRITVRIDPHLTAKAAAGSDGMRIRASTGFSQNDIDQLFEHELLVHSATKINGQSQPLFRSLGLGAPRTTMTQEGLATFAEMITATMDLRRLRRIALRIKAIQMALDGGNFIDIFRFFLASGQDERESFQSSARIFRGGQVRGQVVFTKDVVYLKGLCSVQTFLKKAIEQRKIDYPLYLFTGRLALGDVLSLEEFFQKGILASPLYVPGWVAKREALAVYLSYSLFTSRIALTEIELRDFGSESGPRSKIS